MRTLLSAALWGIFSPSQASASSIFVQSRRINEDTEGEDAEEGEDLSPEGKKLINFASLAAGAVVLEKPKSSKGYSNLLNDDRDKYGISPCKDKKWLVIGLSEDILVRTVVMENYEKYSSLLHEFQVLGSTSYPASEWYDFGNYTAEARLGAQYFHLEHPAWARYLKFKFLTMHGSEFYCTLSQIKVFGSTVLETFKREVEISELEMLNMRSSIEFEHSNAAEAKVEEVSFKEETNTSDKVAESMTSSESADLSVSISSSTGEIAEVQVGDKTFGADSEVTVEEVGENQSSVEEVLPLQSLKITLPDEEVVMGGDEQTRTTSSGEISVDEIASSLFEETEEIGQILKKLDEEVGRESVENPIRSEPNVNRVGSDMMEVASPADLGSNDGSSEFGKDVCVPSATSGSHFSDPLEGEVISETAGVQTTDPISEPVEHATGDESKGISHITTAEEEHIPSGSTDPSVASTDAIPPPPPSSDSSTTTSSASVSSPATTTHSSLPSSSSSSSSSPPSSSSPSSSLPSSSSPASNGGNTIEERGKDICSTLRQAEVNCSDLLKFSSFKAKMLSRIQNNSEADKAPMASQDNVFKLLMQKIKTLETSNAILELYATQAYDCYRCNALHMNASPDNTTQAPVPSFHRTSGRSLGLNLKEDPEAVSLLLGGSLAMSLVSILVSLFVCAFALCSSKARRRRFTNADTGGGERIHGMNGTSNVN